MKKKHLIWIILGIVIIAGTALAFTPGNKDSASKTPVLAATIYPLYDIAQIVAGDQYNVRLLLPPGTSPHTFDPTPAHIRAIQGAETLFMIGNGLDEWAADIAAQAGNIPTVTVDRAIAIRETTDHDGHTDEHANEDDYDDHPHGPKDPHYWLDPRNAAIIADTIAMTLSELMPSEKALFEANAAAFAAEVETKSITWKESLEPIEGKAFITLHDAFYYLADFATLDLVATFEPFPGREPTPQYLAELTEEIEEHAVTGLFSEPQLAIDPIESFARDNNITIGILDPLGGIEGRTSYIDLIDFNIQVLLNTLQ